MREVRTRFAPSPTGFLHIGSLRTALYEYAFAKNRKGKFILRIEDTDRNRFVPGATEKLISILRLFGLNWDEGPEIGGPYTPYIQSERVKTGIYKKYAELLIKQGNAYYCFCPPQSKEEIKESHAKKELILRDKCRDLTPGEVESHLKRGEKPAIRLKVPDNEKINYYDFIIKKEISWNTKDVDEVMLLKSDGFPTYQLAVVVDDVAMEISHIIRALEWLPSTPVHLLLFKYLGFKIPEIGHVTDILDPAGGKLSKRKGAVSCEEFLAEGYLPEAILNFIMLLGWAPKDNRELFTLEEFVHNFEKGDLQIANPIFNRVKLDWFNGVYIRKTENAHSEGILRKEPLKSQICQFFKGKYSEEQVEKILPLVKDRMVKLADFETLAGPIFKTCTTIDPTCLSSIKKEHLEGAIRVLSELNDWQLETINERLTTLIKENGWKTGDFYMSLRIAVCGCKVTPPINESLVILGKDKTLAQLKQALTLI